MNLTKLEEINAAADDYTDAKMAMDRLPSDAEVLAHLEENPLDFRIGVRTPPREEDLKQALEENPGVPEEMVREHMSAHFSVDIAVEDQQKMLTLMRTLLAERVENMAKRLRDLGVDPESAEAAAIEAEKISGQRLH